MLVTGGGTGSPQAPCGFPARPWAEASAPDAISLTVYRHPARVNSTPQEFSLRGYCAAYRASAAHAAGKVVMLLADGELAARSPLPVINFALAGPPAPAIRPVACPGASSCNG